MWQIISSSRALRLTTSTFACIVFTSLASFSSLAQVPSQSVVKKIGLIVTDKDSNVLNGIRKEELVVTVAGKRIDDFDLVLQTLPVAYVLAVDNSGSIRSVLNDVLQGAAAVYGENGQKNLVLLMRFVSRDKIQISERFSSDKTYLDSKLALFAVEGGQTALIDAVYKAVQIVAGQNNLVREYRRAVVVVSDGEDRDSENSEKALRELIAKENVQIFFVGLTELLSKDIGFVSKSSVAKSKEFIETITKETGGIAIYPKIKNIGDAAKTIGSTMNEQYSLTLRFSAAVEMGAKVEISFVPNANRKKTVLHYRPLIQ